jgi:hypothetical protein
MAELDFTEYSGGNVLTPASGVTAVYTETDHRVRSKDPSAFYRNLTQFVNFSTASQAPAAATRTYITGSAVGLPAAGRLQIGTMFRWGFDVTKTAAGTVAAHTIDIAFGTAGTTADTARVTFTSPAGTAVAAVDTGYILIEAVVRGPLSASGIVSGNILFQTNNTGGSGGIFASGRQTFIATVQSSTFDVTLPTFVGLCMTSGTAAAFTIQQVVTEVFNL